MSELIEFSSKKMIIAELLLFVGLEVYWYIWLGNGVQFSNATSILSWMNIERIRTMVVEKFGDAFYELMNGCYNFLINFYRSLSWNALQLTIYDNQSRSQMFEDICECKYELPKDIARIIIEYAFDQELQTLLQRKAFDEVRMAKKLEPNIFEIVSNCIVPHRLQSLRPIQIFEEYIC